MDRVSGDVRGYTEKSSTATVEDACPNGFEHWAACEGAISATRHVAGSNIDDGMTTNITENYCISTWENQAT